MSNDTKKKIPAQSWPFLLQSAASSSGNMQIARCIYDLRLSFIMPKQTVYTAHSKWFKVVLTKVQQNKLTFIVYNSITHNNDTISCIKNTDIDNTELTSTAYTFSDTKNWLDTDNCFIQVSKDIGIAENLSLQVCASCILLTARQPKLSITCGSVRRKGILQDEPKKSDTLSNLVFTDGYNTELSYSQSVLTIMIKAGVGTQLPFHYHYWQEYSGGNDNTISGQRDGAYSINGLTGNVLINPGPSVSILPQLSDDSLILNLRAAKTQQQQ